MTVTASPVVSQGRWENVGRLELPVLAATNAVAGALSPMRSHVCKSVSRVYNTKQPLDIGFDPSPELCAALRPVAHHYCGVGDAEATTRACPGNSGRLCGDCGLLDHLDDKTTADLTFDRLIVASAVAGDHARRLSFRAFLGAIREPREPLRVGSGSRDTRSAAPPRARGFEPWRRRRRNLRDGRDSPVRTTSRDGPGRVGVSRALARGVRSVRGAERRASSSVPVLQSVGGIREFGEVPRGLARRVQGGRRHEHRRVVRVRPRLYPRAGHQQGGLRSVIPRGGGGSFERRITDEEATTTETRSRLTSFETRSPGSAARGFSDETNARANAVVSVSSPDVTFAGSSPRGSPAATLPRDAFGRAVSTSRGKNTQRNVSPNGVWSSYASSHPSSWSASSPSLVRAFARAPVPRRERSYAYKESLAPGSLTPTKHDVRGIRRSIVPSEGSPRCITRRWWIWFVGANGRTRWRRRVVRWDGAQNARGDWRRIVPSERSASDDKSPRDR